MKKIILGVSVLIVFFSCNNSQEFTRDEKNAKVSELIDVSSQFFIFTTNNDTTLVGTKGTKISISKKSFCYKDGNIVKGEIKIELREFYSISKMLLSKLYTISDKELIESGGMLYINATSNGQELSLLKDKSILIEFQSKYDMAMQPFYGNLDSIEQMNWITKNNDTALSSIALADTIKYSEKNHLHNILRAINLGWINCDKFMNLSETSEIFVNTDGGIDSSIFCGVVLKKYNSIVPGVYTKNGLMKFSPLPLNETVTLVLISYREDGYFYGVKDVVIRNNETYDVVMVPVSKKELKNKLDEFDKQRPLF